jgi:hypothetical protein
MHQMEIGKIRLRNGCCHDIFLIKKIIGRRARECRCPLKTYFFQVACAIFFLEPFRNNRPFMLPYGTAPYTIWLPKTAMLFFDDGLSGLSRDKTIS